MIYLGLALYCIVLYGFSSFFKNICHFDKRVTWLSAVALIVLVLYFSAFIGFLKPAGLILAFVGVCLTLWTLYQMIQGKTYRYLRVNVLGIWLTFYIILFVHTFSRVHLNHYDNYSHWATIVKFLFTEGRLPTMHDPMIAYTSYPMGASLFVYFTTIFAGYSDQVLMIGQFVLIVTCIYAMFAVVRDQSRTLVLSMMFTVIATFNHFNSAIRMNNLLVDFLLPLVALAGVAGIFRMKNQLKAMSIYTFLVVSMLTLIKSSAIFFALIVLIYYLYVSTRQIIGSTHRWINISTVITTSALSFIPIYVWNLYVKSHFPVTKHEVSVSSYQEIFQAKDTSIIHQITDLFMDTITSLSTLSTKGILLVQVLMLASYIIIRFVVGRKNPLLKQLLLIDIITVVYYIGIYLMFLFSMPTDEALTLAGFDRYASSIVIMALGLMMMFLARQMDYSLFEQRMDYRNFKSFKSLKTKKLYQYSSMLLVFLSTLLLLSESGGLLYNEQTDQDSVAAQFKAVTENSMTLNETRYLVVSTKQTEVDNYFVGFLGKYWLYSPNVEGRENFVMDKEAFKSLFENYDKIVILEEHFTFNEMTKLIVGKEYGPGIYDSQTILNGE